MGLRAKMVMIVFTVVPFFANAECDYNAANAAISNVASHQAKDGIFRVLIARKIEILEDGSFAAAYAQIGIEDPSWVLLGRLVAHASLGGCAVRTEASSAFEPK